MKAKCICGKCEFGYGEILSLAPGHVEFEPSSVICSLCGVRLRITTRSRIKFSLVIFVTIFGGLVLFGYMNPKLSLLAYVVVGGSIALTSYLLVWPMQVELEKWSPFNYWLPKSRLVGYGVYLLLPAMLIIGIFILAVKFELGM